MYHHRIISSLVNAKACTDFALPETTCSVITAEIAHYCLPVISGSGRFISCSDVYGLPYPRLDAGSEPGVHQRGASSVRSPSSRVVSVKTYTESIPYKLMAPELQLLADLSRLGFNIRTETPRGDGHPLHGWVLRLEFNVSAETAGILCRIQKATQRYHSKIPLPRTTGMSSVVRLFLQILIGSDLYFTIIPMCLCWMAFQSIQFKNLPFNQDLWANEGASNFPICISSNATSLTIHPSIYFAWLFNKPTDYLK
ncbi:hypothetical protein C8J57DRAFT_1238103 [Mycena rebaudengoi]|nr:hypothetical protein C8J57DRAFT_1238103 [Mycena rebaudengoi]